MVSPVSSGITGKHGNWVKVYFCLLCKIYTITSCHFDAVRGREKSIPSLPSPHARKLEGDLPSGHVVVERVLAAGVVLPNRNTFEAADTGNWNQNLLYLVTIMDMGLQNNSSTLLSSHGLWYAQCTSLSLLYLTFILLPGSMLIISSSSVRKRNSL